MAHIGRHTSSSKESLRLIQVHEGRCKDAIVVSSFYGVSYFTTKALGATFATNVDVPRVRIMPSEHCFKLSPTILYLLALISHGPH